MKVARWLAPLLVAAVALGADAALAQDPFVPNFRVVLQPEHPHPASQVNLILIGPSPYGSFCAQVADPRVHSQERVSLELLPTRQLCNGGELWNHTFDLGRFAAGPHRVLIEVGWFRTDSSGNAHHEVYSRFFEFTVSRDSTTLPVNLPYVESIRFGGASGLICPGDSIPVRIAGYSPNECFHLTRIDLIPVGNNQPPVPPTVRLIIDTTGCAPRECGDSLVAFGAAFRLPPLSIPGPYYSRFQMALGSCIGSEIPPVQYSDDVEFRVAERCSTTLPHCFDATFDHPNGHGACDATVGPGRAGRIGLGLESSVALSGLQGELSFDQPGLRITGMTPVGPAAGMRLTWTPTRSGAKFVMFAESGAPIPSVPPETDGLPIRVLAIAVEQASNARMAPVTRLVFSDLLGSDAAGGAVRECPPLPWEFRLQEAARICRERDCDWNADGVLDVRDLVMMVHCVRDSSACPDSGGVDCNADGTFNLDDVLCCARHLLGLPRCNDCGPDTTAARREPIVLSLGAPSESGGELMIPIDLTYAERIGAARVVLDYPADRYEVIGVGMRELTTPWLDLYEVRDGKIVLGLIRTGSMTDAVGQRLRVVARLRLRAGQLPGGSIVASESEFSGMDGVRLEIEETRGEIELAGRATIDLSGARPNPFTSGTRFTLTLDRSALVELGVFDVSGRMVAALHRGLLTAGAHEFSWDGSGSDGTTAATGVYFYRASVSGNTATRKLVLLRGK